MPYPYSAFEARKFLVEVLRREPGREPLAPMMICLRSNPNILVGCISLRQAKEGLVLGYWMGRAYRKRGFVSEAARVIVQTAFDRGSTVIMASYVAGNAPSARIIRSLGFRRTRVRHAQSRYLARKTLAVQNTLTRTMWMAKTKPPRLPSS